jgi:hypothetical protein
MKQWYVVETTSSGQTVLGPMGMDQLQELQRAGKLVGSTQVCEVGADRWSRADEIAELRGLFGASAPASSMSASSIPASSIPASSWPAAQATATATTTTSAGGPAEIRKLPPFSFGNAFELTFDVFRRSWVMLLFCGLLVFAGQMVVQLAGLPLQYLTGGFQVGRNGAGPWQQATPDFDPSQLPLLFAALFLVVVVSVLLSIPLSAAQTWIGVRAVRGQLDIADTVQPFRRYFAVLGTGLLAMLIIVVLVAPGLIAVFAGTAMGSASSDGDDQVVGVVLILFGVLLFMISAVYVNVRLYFALTIACDPEQGECGPLEALKRSWELTRGRFWVTFAFFVCLGLLVMATLLLFCIGLLIVGMPLLSAGYGAYYELARRDLPATRP